MSAPTVAAVIPVYNGRRFLREAVQSVVEQTLAPAELVIVDDGSRDDSLAALDGLKAPFPVEIVRQPNAGQSAARNRGARKTTCEFIALLDQDDRWLPAHLARLAPPLLAQPALGWSYSNVDEIDEAGALVRRGLLDQLELKHPLADVPSMLRANMHILPTSAVIRRDAFLAVGGFDERLSGYEDDDLFLRLFRHGYQSAYLPEATAEWRVWPNSSAHSSRMVASERIYAQKLVDAFGSNGHYVEELIAPRFLYAALYRYDQAAEREDWDACREAGRDARRFAALMPRDHKLRWKTMMMQQPRLHAALSKALDRLPRGVARWVTAKLER